jgi:penicillin-binding protein 1A
MVGGRNFATEKVNLAVGTDGGGSGRQAGSSMKPFVLAAAVKQGISVNSKFEGPGELKIPKANAGKTWTVHNYGNSDYGVLSLIEATRNSVNTVYAQLMVKVKPENVVPQAQRMGITSPLQAVNALVLGSESVSPLEMASAYSTFAMGGVHTTPTVVVRVERSDGSVVAFDQPQEQVFTPEENDIVTYCLRQVVSGGTGKGADFGKPAAGKTGTTQDNNDAWFVGFTPNGLTTAVWMGYDPTVNDDGSLSPRYMDNVHGKPVTGGSFPATMWRKFMQHWTDGMDVGSFHTPKSFPGVVLNGELTTSTSSDTSSSTEPPSSTAPPTTAPTTAPSSTEPTTEPTTEPPTTLIN